MKKELEEMLKRLKEWGGENKEADMTGIEEAIDGELAKIRQQLVEEMVREREDAEPRGSCPTCIKPMMKNGKKKRALRTKNGGKVTLEREQMRCHDCGMTFFPPR